jgi:predicted small lipoprotein YifL
MSCAASSRAAARPDPALGNLLRKTILLGVMLLSVMCTSSCGKKPPHVDPPSDVEDDTFPQIYPNPAENK